MIVMKVDRPIPHLAVALTVGAALLAGCGSTGGTTGSSDRPAVVAAFYPLAYAAERVGGEHVAVENLTEPGGEPHDLELGLTQTIAVEEADLVVVESGFQPAVDDAVDGLTETPVIDAADVVELHPAAAGDDEAHEHSDADPHFWLDPMLLGQLAEAIEAELSRLDPDHAQDYATNLDDLQRDLATLDAEYAEGLAACERSTVVVSHDAFGYLERYGLRFEAIAGLSPDAEPTPAGLAELQEIARREGITTVFSERLASPAMAETLAADLGIATGVLDPIEGLSDQESDQDYVSLMGENLAALRRANGC